jgi:hypothetical protein
MNAHGFSVMAYTQHSVKVCGCFVAGISIFEFRPTGIGWPIARGTISGGYDFVPQPLLAPHCFGPVDRVRFQVLFSAAFKFLGTGPQCQKEISMVAFDAVVAAHWQLE